MIDHIETEEWSFALKFHIMFDSKLQYGAYKIKVESRN